MMELIPGPDFPGGGRIVGLNGIRDAYRTGRGSFKVRSKTRIEQVSPGEPASSSMSFPTWWGPKR